jgi:hypothetical protein
MYVLDPGGLRSKVWICGSFIARITGSNPTEGLHISILNFLCVVQVPLRRADH